MTTLEEGFRTLTRIAENHGISAQEERRLLEEMKSFSVSVQLLGPYHAGKSALLNALLDSRILPAGWTKALLSPSSWHGEKTLFSLGAVDTSNGLVSASCAEAWISPEFPGCGLNTITLF